MQAMLSADPASMLQNPGKTHYTHQHLHAICLRTPRHRRLLCRQSDLHLWPNPCGHDIPMAHELNGSKQVRASYRQTSPVSWDDEEMLHAAHGKSDTLPDGRRPSRACNTLLWDAGATQWGYTKNQYVLIDGKAALHDDGWYLERPGSEQSIKLNIRLNAIGTDSLHERSFINATTIGHPSDLALAHASKFVLSSSR